MCFSKPSTPDYGAQARDDEAKRQQSIREGTNEVNSTFSKFTPGYFKGVGDAFSKYYRPQVDQQGQEARRKIAFHFADNPNSSAANREQGNFERDYAKSVAGVGSGAVDATNQARSAVEGQRGGLLNLVNAGSGLENVAGQASTFAQSYQPPATYSPLGDLFSKYTSNVADYAGLQNRGYAPVPFYQKQVDFLRGSPAGSSRTVG